MHQFTYSYDTDVPLTKYYEGNLKNCNVSITSSDDDMTVYQIFNLFKSYILSVGYTEKSFYDACAFYSEEYNMNDTKMENFDD
jgi:hypothetical protein